MRNMRKWVLGVTLVMLVAGAAPNVHAIALTNTGVDFGIGAVDFTTLVAPVITNTFDFDLNGADGAITSAVYAGAGIAAGLNFYAYQIEHFAGSSVAQVQAMSFDFLGGVSTVFGTTSLVFSGGAFLPPAGFDPGTLAPNFVSDGVSGEVVTFTWLDGVPDGAILPGSFGFVVGVFSPIDPGLVIANLLDSGPEASAAVYAPVPEPGSLLLLGSGLAGLGLWGWRRKKLQETA